jgi:hypothetical protein
MLRQTRCTNGEASPQTDYQNYPQRRLLMAAHLDGPCYRPLDAGIGSRFTPRLHKRYGEISKWFVIIVEILIRYYFLNIA